MPKRILITCLFLSLASVLFSQSTDATCSGAQSSTPPSETAKPEHQGESQDKQKDEGESQEKDKKERKKKDKESQDSGESNQFNDAVAQDLLGRVRDGLEGHSRRLLLSAFDADKMQGYLAFEDQIDAYFNKYETFRVRFRITNVAVEGPKGIVLVDSEIEETPTSGGTPVRKRTQLRFELESGRKGWRVVDVSDRGFFS